MKDRTYYIRWLFGYHEEIINVSFYLFLFGLVVSLPLSKFVMSFCGLGLIGTWLVNGTQKHKIIDFFSVEMNLSRRLKTVPFLLGCLIESMFTQLKLFSKNKPALVFSLIFLMHLAGLFFTTDFFYGFKDIRTKLPLIGMPVIFVTMKPVGAKYFRWIIMAFVAAVLFSTFINTYNYFSTDVLDIRNISRNISHVILSLLISMSVFFLAYMVINKGSRWYIRVLFLVIIAWFICYLVLTDSLTGISICLITFILLTIVTGFSSANKLLKIGLLVVLFGLITGSMIYIDGIIRDFYHVNPQDLTKLDRVTPRGNFYHHNVVNPLVENGNYVWINVCIKELEEEWPKRSTMDLNGNDKKNQCLLHTLVRFMASRGLRKDADGLKQLSDEEIHSIENGVANVNNLKNLALTNRIHEILWEYEDFKRTGDPSRHSAMQRLEFWKASLHIIGENWFTGVGTGDMNIAFGEAYNKMNSPLAPDQRWRSHNQYLSICVGFGIFGLLLFLFAIFYPPLSLGRFTEYYFLVFLITALLAMLTEDTIESQAGVTFFAFFYAFFLFGRNAMEPSQTGKN